MSSIMNGGGSPPPSKNDMIGSIHIYSNGYGQAFFFVFFTCSNVVVGYGIRMPTSRNVPTLPACVPTMRYPPESSRFLEGTAPTQVIKKDAHSVQRNAEARIHQTSGDYGRWYTDPNSDAVKLGFGRIPKQEPRRVYKAPAKAPVTENVQRFESARLGTPMMLLHDTNASYSNTRSLKNTASSDNNFNNTWSSDVPSSSSRGGGSTATKAQYYETLKQLDKQFSRQSRKDLFAATQAERSMSEQIHVVAASHQAAQASKVWGDKLRL